MADFKVSNLNTDGRSDARAGERADAENAEGIGDSGAFAGVDLRCTEEGRQTREKAALDRSFGGGFDEVAEHQVPVLASVVAPRPLVQVALQPLVLDGVMSATDAGFEQAEEPVNRLCVNIAVRVDASVMLDPAVRVAHHGYVRSARQRRTQPLCGSSSRSERSSREPRVFCGLPRVAVRR